MPGTNGQRTILFARQRNHPRGHKQTCLDQGRRIGGDQLLIWYDGGIEFDQRISVCCLGGQKKSTPRLTRAQCRRCPNHRDGYFFIGLRLFLLHLGC